MSNLKGIIRNRTVFIMSHGASIQGLADTIEQYKDLDICYASLGLFTNMEQFILSKIGKQLDIVFDCATVPESYMKHYEVNVRMPRLAKYLDRKESNLWITTHGLVRDSVKVYGPEMLRYHFKTLQVDRIFPEDEIPKWMDVPNSMTLFIASMLAGGASKIFIFGMDGYTGNVYTGVQSYFRWEEHEKERISALGTNQDPGINRDTDGFKVRFPGILENYRKLFGNEAPIYNVSPVTEYIVPQKIMYEQVRELLW